MKDYIVVFLFVTCTKLLFIPFYHSTDMEVHRNWKAITHSKNISEWYFEDTSQWTLDYPPLFAWFEYVLSFPAKLFDARMLDVKHLDYKSQASVLYMRLSVILADMVYVVAIMKIYFILKGINHGKEYDPWITPQIIFAMLMLWNPGLLLVDHVHFQYNGFLNGFLFLSVASMMEENYLLSALWFSMLLNFKHLYIYFAPAYFIYLLKNYCFQLHSGGQINWPTFSVVKFLKLAAVVLSVFGVAFAPFLSTSQLKQVLSQLFPVKRGLTHAYWAPNVWALYNALDRVLVILNRYWTGSKDFGVTNVTKGLVEEHVYFILPSVGVEITILLTFLSILPFLHLIWKSPRNPYIFIQGLVGCAFGSFIFGYHVHEKAIMMIILPMTLLAVTDYSIVEPFILLSSIGHFALFPLFYKTAETPIKIIIVLLHSVYAYRSLKRLHEYRLRQSYLSVIEVLMLTGIIAVQLLSSFGMDMLNLSTKLPFLPLMTISCFCAIGVLYSWISFYSIVTRKQVSWFVELKKNS